MCIRKHEINPKESTEVTPKTLTVSLEKVKATSTVQFAQTASHH